MRLKTSRKFLVALAFFGAVIPNGKVKADPLEEVLGAAHIDPLYSYGTKDCLNQGADENVGLGSQIIKVEMSGDSPTKYPFHSSWPAFTDLASVAKAPYFVTLFANPNITTYVVTTYCPSITGAPVGGPQSYWYYGSGQTAQFADEKTQITNLAKYLLGNPGGKLTGKTFIIENWEGDNALAAEAAHAGQTGAVPWSAKDGMVTWVKTRIAGIQAARAAFPSSPVTVLAGFECNNVKNAMYEDGIGPDASKDWNGTVVPTYPYTTPMDVLPNCVGLDRVSYSCYDTNMIAAPNAYDTQAAVDFLVSRTPGLTHQQVGIGETGVDAVGHTAAQVTTYINNVLAVATNPSNPLAYMLYWEMYNNESGKGFWMIKSPDGNGIGAPDTAWHLFRYNIIQNSASRSTTTEIKANSTKKYTSAFTASGLGTGWSSTNFSGDVSWTPLAGNLLNMKEVTVPAGQAPYGNANLNVTTVAGRALQAGDYVEYTVKRLQSAGIIGTSAFGSNHGSGIGSSTQPFDIYYNGWTPLSWDGNSNHPAKNWDATATLGMRIDTMDGTFATISYYYNGAYIGSWLYQTTATSLNTVSLFAQDTTVGHQFQFGNVQVWFGN